LARISTTDIKENSGVRRPRKRVKRLSGYQKIRVQVIRTAGYQVKEQEKEDGR